MPEPIRAGGGRAPNVFRRGEWVPMRCYRDDEEVDFAIVGTGAGGGTLAFKLAKAGFRVVAFDAGPYWRPLEDFASDEDEQQKLYWTDERISGGEDPIQLGSNNSGRGVGGSTVHFTMVVLRFRPEWFRSRSLLGYGVDWPVSWEEMWPYYDEVEEMLQISGPVSYPWGPPRGRYPRRPHEVNAAGLVLARGCEALGIPWVATPLATLSSPRGEAPPCVYRGFCAVGCSTNAKQSALVTWIPRAVEHGAEIRDLAMVGRIETGADGRAAGVLYHRDGEWRRQRAKHVVAAGYSIETPRLLLNSATPRFPHGLANGSGLVGKGLMVHSNHGVWGIMDEEVRCYKGPPVMTITEHWNYTDEGKDFHGGYQFGSQGPLPRAWAQATAAGRGLWGMELREEMTRYNHVAGLKMVGEVEPRECNRVELADETDPLGLPIPRITFSYSDNDRRLIRHAVDFMRQTLEAAGGKETWADVDTAHLMGGCPMGSDPERSVTDPYGRTWEIPNLWICDGSLFPTGGGVNPSATIMALACRTGDRIAEMGRRGEL
ncbi:MAG TPA: GMC family oxidoreductase [Longimicrobiaceae bacterium]|nr:GMC family oxidoreductase [Longimicrobiaceae bacterium]